jgi:hypothetical protein
MKPDRSVGLRVQEGSLASKLLMLRPGETLYLFAVGIAVLGEPGYSFASALELFPTYKEASIRAEELNRVFPYSVDACVAIVADTMIRQRKRRPTIDRLGDLLLDAEKDGTLERLAGDVRHPETISDFCDAVHMFR